MENGEVGEVCLRCPWLGSCFPHSCLICILQINVGTTVTMTGNGTRPPPAASAEAAPPGPGQASSLAPTSTTVESSTEGVPPPGPAPPPTTSHPRVIRISHQSVEPVVMMHMNIQGELGPVVGRAELYATRDMGWHGGVRERGCGQERPRPAAGAEEWGRSFSPLVWGGGTSPCRFVCVVKGVPPPCPDGGKSRLSGGGDGA